MLIVISQIINSKENYHINSVEKCLQTGILLKFLRQLFPKISLYKAALTYCEKS